MIGFSVKVPTIRDYTQYLNEHVGKCGEDWEYGPISLDREDEFMTFIIKDAEAALVFILKFGTK